MALVKQIYFINIIILHFLQITWESTWDNDRKVSYWVNISERNKAIQ